MYTEIDHPRKHQRKRRRRSFSWLPVRICLLLAAALLLAGAGKALVSSGSAYSGITFSEPDPPSDQTAPVIAGTRDLTVYAGNTISYLSGVTATDDCDPAPKITVDSSCVDLSTPGEYEVVYTAKDASGNISRVTVLVTVIEQPEYFVDLDTIYAAADAKLEEIIRENATVRQQVHDIYAWARLNLRYGGHSDRTDWQQTAYTMLTVGQGDCFGYYAVTKLLFERLGIPNIDVQKVRNFQGDSDHFWSLVSLDGGESWYHFDSTPRAGDGDDFCLVTDAFIDAYSDAHNGSHNRDKSLYPATP